MRVRRADLGMPGHLAAPAVQAFPDPPSDALLRFAHSCFFAALSRRPSLRSARGCATRQASPAVSFSLKRQASPAARTLSLKHSHITVELQKNQRAGVVALFFGRDGRTDGRTGGVLRDHPLRMWASFSVPGRPKITQPQRHMGTIGWLYPAIG